MINRARHGGRFISQKKHGELVNLTEELERQKEQQLLADERAIERAKLELECQKKQKLLADERAIERAKLKLERRVIEYRKRLLERALPLSNPAILLDEREKQLSLNFNAYLEEFLESIN